MTPIVLLLSTAAEFLLVGGQLQLPYQLAIDFHQYSNPSHTASDGECCQCCYFVCRFQCYTMLLLCLRIGETSHDYLGCSIGYVDLGSIGGDNVTFTDSVGYGENPFVVELTALPAEGYQLLIESYIPDILIDHIFVDIPASDLGQSPSPQIYQGELMIAAVNLSYSLGCASSYTLCTVNTVPECISEDECINGSESVSVLMPQTVLAVLPGSESVSLLMPQTDLAILPGQSRDGSAVLVPTSAMPSPTMGAMPSATMDAVTIEGPVAAIVGGALAALLLVAVIAVLVVVGVVVSLCRRKKQPSHPTPVTVQQPPNERMVYEESSDHKHGNDYVTVDPGRDPEDTLFDVANPMYQTTTLPGSREPEYQEAQGDPSRNRNITLTEVPNPMYQTTTLPGSREPEYQETQKEVQNILYEGRPDDSNDSVNNPMYADVKN